MRLFLRSLLLTFFAVTLANAGAFSQTATINTDQLDYPPGSTVIITGTGWQPGETVTLQVLHEGETGDNAISGAHAPFTAVADASGNVSSTWVVPLDEDELGATLLLTAVGGSSGLTASWTFTDAPKILSDPQDASVTHGDNVTFTSTASPKNAIPVTWQINMGTFSTPNWVTVSTSNTGTFSINTFNSDNQTTSSTLTITGVNFSLLNGKKFRAQFVQGQAAFSNYATLTVNKKEIQGSFTAADKTYDGNTSATVTGYSVATKIGTEDVNITGGTATFDTKDAGTGKTVTLTGASLTGTDKANYSLSSVNTTTADITARPITITPDGGQFKYCGQPDPGLFTFSGSEPLITGNSYSGALSRTGSNDVGTYSYTLGTLSAGSNYTLSLAGSNTFQIKDVSLDASGSGTAVQVSTSTSTSSVQLTAVVTNGTTKIDGVTVIFKILDGNGNVIKAVTSMPSTLPGGIASTTLQLPLSTFPTGLYAVKAITTAGCSESLVAYFSIYDPSAGFVTGGGWINSPKGAYSADPTLTGKANFGFNAQYKKGNNTPDGNTEFQFQAGNLNFKSTNYGTGSLVIAGAKAIFQGTGTINGTGNYNFMISAIDGSINGGGVVDKFRIKIQTAGGGVVYDNNLGTADNGDPSTALGGGSIVIHNTGNKSRLMDTVPSKSNVYLANNLNSALSNELGGRDKLSVKVMPNPTSYHFTLILNSLSKENVNLTVTDITGRVVEQRTSVPANSTLRLGSQYHPGTYIAEFVQGHDRVTLRLIKEGK